MRPNPAIVSTVLLPILLVALPGISSFAEQPATRNSSPATASFPSTQPGVSIETYFSPKDQITPIIVELIDRAERTLDIAAYTFSHRDIAKAIVRAHQRGVKIRFVMDYTQSRLTTCRAIDLIESGIEVRTRHRRGFQHNKYIVIDQAVVMTGSFNFSPSADDYNTENVVVFRNAPDIVSAFVANHDTIMADTLMKER